MRGYETGRDKFQLTEPLNTCLQEERGIYAPLWAHPVLAAFPPALGYWLQLEIGCWDRWTLFWLWLAILGLILCSCFLCSCKKYTYDMLFRRVNTQPKRNQRHFVQRCQPWTAYTQGRQNNRKIWKWQGEEVYFANSWHSSQFVSQSLFP